MQSDLHQMMPDRAAANLQRPALTAHAILWLAVLFVLVALLWAHLTQVDEITRADGRVIPSKQVQEIQNLEGGIVAELLVENGQLVAAGDVLLRIDATRFTATFEEVSAQKLTLQARQARLQAELTGSELQIPTDFPTDQNALLDQERELLRARRQELQTSLQVLQQQVVQEQQEITRLEAEISKLSRTVALADKELALTKPLVDTGSIAPVELLRLQREVNELSGQLSNARLALPQARAAKAQAAQRVTERRQQARSQAQTELNEVQASLNQLNASLPALSDQVKRTYVRAPLAGTIKQIFINTVGGVVQPGMKLMELVPSEDSLLIEANIRPSDIAFIHPQQAAVAKFTAYDYAIYGGLEAEVEWISPDTITDEQDRAFFVVHARTQQTHLGKSDNTLPIIPGMVVQLDILTGKKSILDYLLKPLTRARQRALTER